MKILLTSSGLDSKKISSEFLKLVDKPIKQKSILIITAITNDKDKYYTEEDQKNLVKLGFDKKNILILDIGKNLDAPKKTDIIYFCGGNTFYLLDRIKKLGLDKLLKKFVKNGTIYVGVSAGSIIASKDISIAGWGTYRDENYVKLKDLCALNITNIAVFPHFENDMEKEVIDFSKTVNYPVETLKDGQAILIKNKEVIKIK